MAMSRKPDEPKPSREMELEGAMKMLSLCILPVAICIALGVYSLLRGLEYLPKEKTLTDLGNLGSFLQGTTGSFWALASVILIFMAFLMQLFQSKEQREQFETQIRRQEAEREDQRRRFEAERADQQKEIEAQRLQFEAQQESIKRQNFESAFFQLLNSRQHQVANLPYGSARGVGIFNALSEDFRREFEEYLQKLTGSNNQAALSDEQAKKLMSDFYDTQFYPRYESILGSYFRNLYHFVKFISESEMTDKRRYSSLLRAQFSKYELFFLFYNCAGQVGAGFRPFVEEFGLLEHFDRRLMVHHAHEGFYAPGAYR